MFRVDAAVQRWVLAAPWSKPPLSLNDRTAWSQATGVRRAIREWAFYSAKAARIPPLEHITVGLLWIVPDRIARDADNAIPTLKAVCDGLGAPGQKRTKKGWVVSAGALIVPDDTPQHMTKLMPVIRYEKGVSRMSIVVYAGHARTQITQG